MLIPSKFRTIGVAEFFLALSAAGLAFGAWLVFAISDTVLTQAASGAVSEADHLADLLLLQRAVLVIVLGVMTSLIYGLYLLAAAGRERARAARDILRQLKGFERNDWHDDVAVRSGEGLEEIAAMTNALARRFRTPFSGAPRPDGIEEVKSKFLEIISHQLRTPLTAVRWNLEALLKGDLGPMKRRQEDLLRVTEKNYQSVLVMLSDWVEALEVERGMLRLNPEPVDLAAFFATFDDEFKHQARLKGLKFGVRIPKDLPLVYADKLKLRYVFSKLLHNAMGYTPEGGRVSVLAAADGKAVRVEVRDSGIGIPYAEQPEIFKKFFRASNAALMQPNASGVGLFVAKTLIEAHGGTIGFVSDDGAGTAFAFTLPVFTAAGASKKKKRYGA